MDSSIYDIECQLDINFLANKFFILLIQEQCITQKFCIAR